MFDRFLLIAGPCTLEDLGGQSREATGQEALVVVDVAEAGNAQDRGAIGLEAAECELAVALTSFSRRRLEPPLRLAAVLCPQQELVLFTIVYVQRIELGEASVELTNLSVIPVEEGEIARLGPGCALDPTTTECGQAMIHLTQVLEEIMHPETGSLADGSELCRLEVGIGESR